ncbi:MAG TPA: hypothetical protein VN771_05730 [Candidatus Baltobacteraceae bacterium]|nr:hypothetical protein [Candidatus Baltobacteraceae bacterium]
MSDPARPARSSPPVARVAATIVALVVGLSGTGHTAVLAATYPASDYSNVTAFDTCDGTPDTISHSLEALAQSGLGYLGYTSGEYATTGFTRARVLSRASTDQAIYVHSHGDQYFDPYPKQVQGFREDGGDCSQAIIYATDLAAVRPATVHLVLMSTCHLAEAARTSGQPTMAAAYGIDRVKYTDPHAPDDGARFFLGYEGLAWTADMLHFEQRFWGYVTTGHLLGDAYTLARASAAMSGTTVPDWFGTYDYSGAPGSSLPCTRCV